MKGALKSIKNRNCRKWKKPLDEMQVFVYYVVVMYLRMKMEEFQDELFIIW